MNLVSLKLKVCTVEGDIQIWTGQDEKGSKREKGKESESQSVNWCYFPFLSPLCPLPHWKFPRAKLVIRVIVQ